MSVHIPSEGVTVSGAARGLDIKGEHKDWPPWAAGTAARAGMSLPVLGWVSPCWADLFSTFPHVAAQGYFIRIEKQLNPTTQLFKLHCKME